MRIIANEIWTTATCTSWATSRLASSSACQRQGIGTVPGILAGVLIFGVINYGLTFIGVSPNWQLIIKGLIIFDAVTFDIRKYLARK